jgi:hypothetical protein
LLSSKLKRHSLNLFCSNSFHSSLRMVLFEDMFEKKYSTPLCWYETNDNLILGHELVPETPMQSTHKSYHDKRVKYLIFKEGDRIFWSVTPTKGVGRLIMAKKLTYKYIGSCFILKNIGKVACWVALPAFISNPLLFMIFPLRIDERQQWPKVFRYGSDEFSWWDERCMQAR